MGRTASLPTALPERSFSPSLSLGRFNSAVFGGRLPADLAITWSATLTTTAGVTHYSRKNASDPNDFLAPPCLLCQDRALLKGKNLSFTWFPDLARA